MRVNPSPSLVVLSSISLNLGGLIVLDHIVGGASIESSIERFNLLVRRIFPTKSYGQFPTLCKILDLLKWLLSDNKYNSSTLEDVVQEAFGTRERLFDGRSNRERSRIGIMTTTTSTSQLGIFTNYNGEARSWLFHSSKWKGNRRALSLGGVSQPWYL